MRPEKITIGEAIARTRTSLLPGDEVEIFSAAGSQSAASTANSTAGQLVSLNSALEQNRPRVNASAPVEQPAVGVQHR